MNDEFYIGYDTPVPSGSRGVVFGALTFVIGLTAVTAAVLVAGQKTFADASFEFGHPRDFEGNLVVEPYPQLLTDAGPIGLVAPGKHGADPLVRAFDGQRIKLRGTSIQRDGWSLIEMESDSVSIVSAANPSLLSGPSQVGSPSTMELTGEIVDAKCYLGVMNPGEGAVHRDCAGVCIRGGLPPMFATRLSTGQPVLMRMVTRAGQRLGSEIGLLAGKPVVVRGAITSDLATGRWTLSADLQDYRLRQRQ